MKRGDLVALSLASTDCEVACHVVVSGPNRSQVVLVGDDQIRYVDNTDVRPITEDDFCEGCGQIGCH